MRWFEGAGQARLGHDKAIVAEDQPGLTYVRQPDGSLALVGDFTLKLASGTPHRIATRIEFPGRYPDDEPLAFETARRFVHDANHHFFTNDGCCLWLDVETRWRADDPDALRRFLDELKVFYYRQLMMEADPKLPYPGPSRGHGAVGYLDHLEERLRMRRHELPRMLGAISGGIYRNAPCPCGSRIRYRNCHRLALLRFRSRIASEALRAVVTLLEQVRDGKGPASPSPGAGLVLRGRSSRRRCRRS